MIKNMLCSPDIADFDFAVSLLEGSGYSLRRILRFVNTYFKTSGSRYICSIHWVSRDEEKIIREQFKTHVAWDSFTKRPEYFFPKDKR